MIHDHAIWWGRRQGQSETLRSEVHAEAGPGRTLCGHSTASARWVKRGARALTCPRCLQLLRPAPVSLAGINERARADRFNTPEAKAATRAEIAVALARFQDEGRAPTRLPPQAAVPRSHEGPLWREHGFVHPGGAFNQLADAE